MHENSTHTPPAQGRTTRGRTTQGVSTAQGFATAQGRTAQGSPPLDGAACNPSAATRDIIANLARIIPDIHIEKNDLNAIAAAIAKHSNELDKKMGLNGQNGQNGLRGGGDMFALRLVIEFCSTVILCMNICVISVFAPPLVMLIFGMLYAHFAVLDSIHEMSSIVESLHIAIGGIMEKSLENSFNTFRGPEFFEGYNILLQELTTLGDERVDFQKMLISVLTRCGLSLDVEQLKQLFGMFSESEPNKTRIALFMLRASLCPANNRRIWTYHNVIAVLPTALAIDDKPTGPMASECVTCLRDFASTNEDIVLSRFMKYKHKGFHDLALRLQRTTVWSDAAAKEADNIILGAIQADKKHEDKKLTTTALGLIQSMFKDMSTHCFPVLNRMTPSEMKLPDFAKEILEIYRMGYNIGQMWFATPYHTKLNVEVFQGMVTLATVHQVYTGTLRPAPSTKGLSVKEEDDLIKQFDNGEIFAVGHMTIQQLIREKNIYQKGHIIVRFFPDRTGYSDIFKTYLQLVFEEGLKNAFNRLEYRKYTFPLYELVSTEGGGKRRRPVTRKPKVSKSKSSEKPKVSKSKSSGQHARRG